MVDAALGQPVLRVRWNLIYNWVLVFEFLVRGHQEHGRQDLDVLGADVQARTGGEEGPGRSKVRVVRGVNTWVGVARARGVGRQWRGFHVPISPIQTILPCYPFYHVTIEPLYQSSIPTTSKPAPTNCVALPKNDKCAARVSKKWDVDQVGVCNDDHCVNHMVAI